MTKHFPRKKVFSKQNLKQDYGFPHAIAIRIVSSFYKSLENSRDQNVFFLFTKWRSTFKHLYGGVLNSETIKTQVNEYAHILGFQEIIPEEFLFCLYSYYELVVKLLSTELFGLHFENAEKLTIQCLISSQSLIEVLNHIESGDLFKNTWRIRNYWEPGPFSWYLSAWNEKIAGAITGLVGILAEYDLSNFEFEQNPSCELLQGLYNAIIPPIIRHDLGEYYTPSWFAEYTIKQVKYDGSGAAPVLDPGCGSGSFLVQLIRIYRELDQEKDSESQLREILKNIIGIDVNPVAVLTARTNYLIAIADLISQDNSSSEIELPVYLADALVETELENPGESPIYAFAKTFDYIVGNPQMDQVGLSFTRVQG